MMRHRQLKHRFVQNVPDSLEPGILYISMEYGTAAHSCCCGCGEEVVTPFTPTDWNMTFDGETISLRPSIGNWNFACRSHYLIDRGQIVEANPWSNAQISAERLQDTAAKARYYGTPVPASALEAAVPPARVEKQAGRTSWLRRALSRLSR